jgi:hypothetical protein
MFDEPSLILGIIPILPFDLGIFTKDYSKILSKKGKKVKIVESRQKF